MVFPVRLLMLFLGMVSIVTGANITMAQTQSQGSQERPGSAQGAGSQSIGQASLGSAAGARGSSGGPSFWVVPSVTVSERYDSNIRQTATKLYDYVTVINPSARVEYRGDLVQGTLLGGFRSEVYARNPELNYVGANASVAANLDNVAGRMVRGLGLSITDSVMYTPQPQAFLTPGAAETSLFHGIQVQRSNTLTNAANIRGTYAIAPLAQFISSYSHQMRRFLDPPDSGSNGALFNAVTQSFSAGPQYQITPTQLIGASYRYQHLSSEPSTGGMGTGNVTVVHEAMATWRTLLSRELTIDVTPGVAILTRVPEKPQWTMRGSLQWTDGRTTAEVSYVRGVRPGLVISSAALISDVVAASLSRDLTSQWSVSVNLNYAINKTINSISQDPPLRFESFGETASLNYAFYPGMVASASITNYNFTRTSGIQQQNIDRQIALISLTAEWN